MLSGTLLCGRCGGVAVDRETACASLICVRPGDETPAGIGMWYVEYRDFRANVIADDQRQACTIFAEYFRGPILNRLKEENVALSDSADKRQYEEALQRRFPTYDRFRVTRKLKWPDVYVDCLAPARHEQHGALPWRVSAVRYRHNCGYYEDFASRVVRFKRRPHKAARSGLHPHLARSYITTGPALSV